MRLRIIGEMAEWSNAAVSKTVVPRSWDRGFESPSLRNAKLLPRHAVGFLFSGWPYKTSFIKGRTENKKNRRVKRVWSNLELQDTPSGITESNPPYYKHVYCFGFAYPPKGSPKAIRKCLSLFFQHFIRTVP